MAGEAYLASYAIDRERLWCYIQYRHRIERLALVLGGDVEMLACTASS